MTARPSPFVLHPSSFLLLLLLLLPAAALADARGDRFWRSIAQGEPPATLGARSLFDYGRKLCEAREHPKRLLRVFQLAAAAQDRDPQSRGFGNLRWTWRDPGVTDANAVEFCMQDALVVWIEHRQWLPEPSRIALRELMEYAIEGCLRHRVPSSYTNIAILNAANLIVLGEQFDRPDVTAEGAGRLDAYYLWTWQFGTREFCSPTYYGVDLDGLRFIQTYARFERARLQARAAWELIWSDIAANWYVPAQKLAGANSRSYDYLRGLGHLDRNLSAAGFLAADPSAPRPDPRYEPPAALAELSRRLPRLVRQHWGIAPSESRTHWMHADITLSCTGAGSGYDDSRLTVDLPGDRQLPRCYFIPDGREDPYGKIRYETSTARHLKALHLKPFWAAAQRGPDALGLVVYRREDLAAPETVNVQSHMVLRASHDGLWLAGRPLNAWPKRCCLAPGEALVVRYGTAGLGIRVPWARRGDGQAAEVALVDDGNPHGVVRLTIEHRAAEQTIEPAAIVWVQAGSGLADESSFGAWRARFEKATVPAAEISDKRLSFEVPGAEGPVAVSAWPPFEQGETLVVPEPSLAVLEVDGREIGRPILETLEPARSARSAIGTTNPLAVPAEGSVGFEAEAGLVFHGMAIADDPGASGGRHVWQPSSTRDGRRVLGSVLWAIRLSKPGRYYLWGRVSADNTESDSFYVQVVAPGLAWPARAAWHLRAAKAWNWQVLALDKGREARPLDLPAGVTLIWLRPREAGARLDRLWLSPNPKERPTGAAHLPQ